MKNRWALSIKEKARELRKQGYSFGQLTTELNVSKSTLHAWIRDVKRPEKFSQLDRIRWAKEIQPLGAAMQKQKREQRISNLMAEIKTEIHTTIINSEMKKALLSALYWSEGSKGRGMLVFANTDPRLVLLFTTLLRECYQVQESKFRVRLHLHYYHSEKPIKLFWSKLLKIPEDQFTKTYRKHRSKERTFRRNFGGICFLKYNSDDLRERLVQYAYALGEQITGKIDVPVA